MKVKKLFFVCVLFFMVIFFSILSVSAYVYAHKGLSSVPCTIYLADSLSTSAQNRCVAAMETWNNGCFSYDCLTSGGTITMNSWGVEDNMNTITFVSTSDRYLGLTHMTQKKYTLLWLNWYLVEFDINMNPYFDWYVNTSTHGITLEAFDGYYDFESTALHELGHALGLDHPDEQYSNGALVVMYYSQDPQTTIRDLSEDDRLGVVNLY